jgi:hypothetical protein
VIRIFSSLAVLALIGVSAALLLGLNVDDLQSLVKSQVSQDARDSILAQASAHRLAGLAAALGVILVNSIAVTYFIGTGRWCKEVVERYRLDHKLLARSRQLKRRTFPWSVAGMLAIIGVAALGAASDPGTGRSNTADWVMPHYFGALIALAFLALSFFVQATNIKAHYDVISDILADVGRIRGERGMET